MLKPLGHTGQGIYISYEIISDRDKCSASKCVVVGL